MENKDLINDMFLRSLASYSADVDLSITALESIKKLSLKYKIDNKALMEITTPVTMMPHISLFSRTAPWEEYIKTNIPYMHKTVFVDIANLLEEKGYGPLLAKVREFVSKKKDENGK